MKKSITSFAREMAQLVYEISIESMDSLMTYDSPVPFEFADKIVDVKKHSFAMKRLMAKAIAEDAEDRPDYYLEDDFDNPGKKVLRYQSDLQDFNSLMSDYITKLYEERFPQPKPEPTIEDIINEMDNETLDKQILMVVTAAELQLGQSKTSNGHWKKVHKEKANTMFKLSEFLIKVKNSKFDFADQIQLENRPI